MKLIKSIIILFLITAYSLPSLAAVQDATLPTACSVVVADGDEAADGKGESEKESEEEPDCE